MSLQRSANVAGIIAIARKENMTIRQLYQRLAGSHGKLALVGSVTRIADTMQRWFDMGACDGFILQPSTMPGNLREVTDLLVPELRDRGLLRVGYEGATLREHLGLRRPASRYASARAAVAAQ
jgi:alkanesulfonate monooxygenase